MDVHSIIDMSTEIYFKRFANFYKWDNFMKSSQLKEILGG